MFNSIVEVVHDEFVDFFNRGTRVVGRIGSCRRHDRHTRFVLARGVVELEIRGEVQIVERTHGTRLGQRVLQIFHFRVRVDRTNHVVTKFNLRIDKLVAHGRDDVVRAAVGIIERRSKPVVTAVVTYKV